MSKPYKSNKIFCSCDANWLFPLVKKVGGRPSIEISLYPHFTYIGVKNGKPTHTRQWTSVDFNAGPPSARLVQHLTNTGSMADVYWWVPRSQRVVLCLVYRWRSVWWWFDQATTVWYPHQEQRHCILHHYTQTNKLEESSFLTKNWRYLTSSSITITVDS